MRNASRSCAQAPQFRLHIRTSLQRSDGEHGLRPHVVIKNDANIEYLAAKAIVKWSTSGDEFSANPSDIWLKVLIDNNEDNLGWIHTEEDFAAVGLPRQKAER